MKTTPVGIVTGFLGSGKTTLLSQVLRHREMVNTAVIVNEFGEVSLDHLLVADTTENIIELRNGCLCCTIRGDLALTLRDLFEKRLLGDIPDFNYVAIETTGVADPVPLLHTLVANPNLRKAFSMDVVIACVDAIHGQEAIARNECAASQLAIADLVLLTKTDLADEESCGQIRKLVRRMNSAAELLESVHGDVDPVRLFRRGIFEPPTSVDCVHRWIDGQNDSGSHGYHDHGSEYTAHHIIHDEPISMSGTSVFLNHVVNDDRCDILRIKGLAEFREKPGVAAVIHAVQNKFYPIQWLDRWPDENRSSRLVFIGRGIDPGFLTDHFRELCVQ